MGSNGSHSGFRPIVALRPADHLPDEGHIHIVLDGQIVAMACGTQQDLHGLKPGTHSPQAEFVAIDHLPFQNR